MDAIQNNKQIPESPRHRYLGNLRNLDSQRRQIEAYLKNKAPMAEAAKQQTNTEMPPKNDRERDSGGIDFWLIPNPADRKKLLRVIFTKASDIL